MFAEVQDTNKRVFDLLVSVFKDHIHEHITTSDKKLKGLEEDESRDNEYASVEEMEEYQVVEMPAAPVSSGMQALLSIKSMFFSSAAITGAPEQDVTQIKMSIDCAKDLLLDIEKISVSKDSRKMRRLLDLARAKGNAAPEGKYKDLLNIFYKSFDARICEMTDRVDLEFVPSTMSANATAFAQLYLVVCKSLVVLKLDELSSNLFSAKISPGCAQLSESARKELIETMNNVERNMHLLKPFVKNEEAVQNYNICKGGFLDQIGRLKAKHVSAPNDKIVMGELERSVPQIVSCNQVAPTPR